MTPRTKPQQTLHGCVSEGQFSGEVPAQNGLAPPCICAFPGTLRRSCQECPVNCCSWSTYKPHQQHAPALWWAINSAVCCNSSPKGAVLSVLGEMFLISNEDLGKGQQMVPCSNQTQSQARQQLSRQVQILTDLTDLSPCSTRTHQQPGQYLVELQVWTPQRWRHRSTAALPNIGLYWAVCEVTEDIQPGLRHWPDRAEFGKPQSSADSSVTLN